MVDQIDNENMDMPDEADDTNINDRNQKSFGIFNMINYVTTSIQDFVQAERGEFEADADETAEETYGTCWEIEDDVLPPVQSIYIPQGSPQRRHPRPPKQMHTVVVIRPRQGFRDQRKAGASRDQRKAGGMGLLKRLISVPQRGPRILKKKEQKVISAFGVVKGDDGPNVSKFRYYKNTGIRNRQKWARL